MPHALCMGELLAEFVATKNEVSLADAPGFIKAPGGAPANVAVALKRLGLSSGFVGKVGRDAFGDYLDQCLKDTGVDTSNLLRDESARTTAVFVAVWADGHKELCFYRNPGADMMLRAEELSSKLFDGARLFHFGSIGYIHEPLAGAQRWAIRQARERGLFISFDPNYRPTLWPSPEAAQKAMFEGYRQSHLVKLSQEEFLVATGHDDFRRGAEAVLACGVELLLISRGENGAIATNGAWWVEVPAKAVKVVETTGAGDAFMAAMITRLLPERERLGSLSKVSEAYAREALHFAVAVGALACTKPGAIPALPTLAEVRAFLGG